MGTLLESGDPWFAAAEALLVGVAVALAVGLVIRLLARRMLLDEDRAQRTSLVAFWGVVAIFGLMALTRLLGGPAAEVGLSTAGNRLFETLPDLVVALVLLVVGSILATAARSAILRSLAPHRPRLAEFLATASRMGILLLAVLLAARQVGVQTAVLDGLLLLLVAAGALALALAAGLGGRDLAGAYAAGRHAADILTVGDVVEIDGRRGRVIRLGPTSVRLHLPGGVVAEIPNSVMLQQTVTVFEHDESVRPPPASPSVRAAPSGGDAQDGGDGADGEETTIITTVVEVDADGEATRAVERVPPADQQAVETAPPSVDDEAETRTFPPAPVRSAASVEDDGEDEDPGSAATAEGTAVLDREELRRAAGAWRGPDTPGPGADDRSDDGSVTQAFDVRDEPGR